MRIELVTEPLSSAFWRERPEKGLLPHSDRASQYASDGYLRLIKSFNMTQSIGSWGDCWDNAPMERFFDSLMTELIGDCVFKGMLEAKTIIFESIEATYNRKRIDSALRYFSPACFEKKYWELGA